MSCNDVNISFNEIGGWITWLTYNAFIFSWEMGEGSE